LPKSRRSNGECEHLICQASRNRNAATMDEVMTSTMTPGINMPPKGSYGLYEKILAEEAAKAGVSPREFQEVGWAGFKNMKDPKYTSGKPMIEHVNDAIERSPVESAEPSFRNNRSELM
jgi:hypothetical protein